MSRIPVLPLAVLAALLAGPAAAQPTTLICAALAQKLEQTSDNGEFRLLSEALFEAASLDCDDIARELLGKGASVKARNRGGATALSIAASKGSRRGDRSAAGSDGADLHHRDLSGATPLLSAAREGRRRVAALLLEAGADPNAADKKGVTPLIAAAFGGHRRLVEMLIEAGSEVDAVDETGKVALIYAAGRAFADIAEILVSAGADPDGVWGHRLTPLMWAAGHANDAPESDGISTAALLLDAGADVSRQDDRGRDALMIAAERGHSAMVEVLLERGADPARRDAQGKTAADLAGSETIRARLSR